MQKFFLWNKLQVFNGNIETVTLFSYNIQKAYLEFKVLLPEKVYIAKILTFI